MPTPTHPHAADQYLAQAWASYNANAVDDADHAAYRAYSIDPDRPGSAAALGWFLLDSGQLPQAKEVLETALKQHPEFPSLHWYWGFVNAS